MKIGTKCVVKSTHVNGIDTFLGKNNKDLAGKVGYFAGFLGKNNEMILLTTTPIAENQSLITGGISFFAVKAEDI